ncbi:MAG: hypothetical protein J7M25_15015 [Deltaproteobacteria bacterium]|nr:hypothetical protein [Deltaproteobacteria bacterium]
MCFFVLARGLQRSRYERRQTARIESAHRVPTADEEVGAEAAMAAAEASALRASLGRGLA